MALTVRKGNEGDFRAIFGLIKDLAEFENAPGDVKNSVAQMKREKNMFKFFVAEEDGVVVGFALYYLAYYTWVGKSLYLDDIYIKPEFRSRRIGSMLLRKVFEVARKENCKRVRWQVLDSNSNAIGFYKKHGAVIHREWYNCDFGEKEIRKLLSRK